MCVNKPTLTHRSGCVNNPSSAPTVRHFVCLLLLLFFRRSAVKPSSLFAGGANGGGGGGGGSNGGPNAGGLNSSELVRQELRAVVSGRAQNAAAAGGVCGTGGLRTPQSPIGMSPGMVATAPGGPGGGGNVQGPGSASSGGGGGGGIGGNGDSMQTSQLPGTSSSSSLLHPAGDMDPSMLFNFHLTPKG